MTSLTRDVHKWLQSLDLAFPVRNVRRDFSNGYLIAEIFSWYFPQDIQMHSYNNGCGLEGKLGNWSQLKTFFKRRNIEIPEELIDGTIHCRPDAAELLVQFLYTKLTNKKIRRLALDRDIDFTDHHYQLTLPLYARNTATMAVKTNLKITEFETEPNIITCQQKLKKLKQETDADVSPVGILTLLIIFEPLPSSVTAQEVIYKHTQHRQEERLEDPRRFNIRPTIGQQCVRKPPSHGTVFTDTQEEMDTAQPLKYVPPRKDSPSLSSSSIHFKEITVNQLDHTAQQSIRSTMSPNSVLPPIAST